MELGLAIAALLAFGPFLFGVVTDVGIAVYLTLKSESRYDRVGGIRFLARPAWACMLLGCAVASLVEGEIAAALLLVPPALLIWWDRPAAGGAAALAGAAVIGWAPFLLLPALLMAALAAWRLSVPLPRLWHPLPAVDWREGPRVWGRIRRCDRQIRQGDLLRARAILAAASHFTRHDLLREAFLDVEERSYQRALSLRPDPEEDSGEMARFATLLHGRALSGIAQFESARRAYDSLPQARSPEEPFDSYLRVLRAENALAAGDFGSARELAEKAHAGAEGRDGYFLRLRACCVLAEAAIDDDQDPLGFEKRIDAADEELISDRWTRRYAVQPDPVQLVRQLFGRRGNLILHQVRVEALRHRAEPESESGWDPEPVGFAMAIAGWSDDLVELMLTEAAVAARDGRQDKRMRCGTRALMELDATRYRLAAQSARTSWSRRLQRALAITLDAAYEVGDHTRIAELLEFARVQALPATTAEASGDLALSTPPVVCLRELARLARPAEADRPPPVNLEAAMRRASGPQGWWLSFWEADEWLYWSLVPPLGGEIKSGRTRLDEGSVLGRALAKLEASLPLLRPGEDPASADFRIAGSPLLTDPDAERQLSVTLGSQLIPPPLLAAARRRDEKGKRLPLAIAPSPSLGYVPWGILAARREEGEVDRLLELCDWVIAPSAALLVQAPEPTGDRTAPLALAVADTTETSELAALEEARRQASAIPATVTVLGGRHWSSRIATVTAIEEALAESGPQVTAAFLCHAVRGTSEEPSRGGLVIAATEDEAGEELELLSPISIFEMTARGVAMPAQVLLQACDTSALSDTASGEWLTLAPAFVAGGTREVVATLYPMPDLYIPDDPVIDSAIEGTSLREAVVRSQRVGLARWEAGMATETAHTPLSWAAYAPICVGPGDRKPSQPAMTAVSARFLRVLSRAIKECREGRRKQLDSGYLLSAVLDDSDIAEMFDGGSNSLNPSTFVWSLGPYALSRFFGFRDGPAREIVAAEGLRLEVSETLVSALAGAVRLAARDGVLVEPEYLLQETLGRKSAAQRILRLLSALSRRPFELTNRALTHNLAQTIAQGQKFSRAAESLASEEELLARAVVALVTDEEAGPTERPAANRHLAIVRP